MPECAGRMACEVRQGISRVTIWTGPLEVHGLWAVVEVLGLLLFELVSFVLVCFEFAWALLCFSVERKEMHGRNRRNDGK